MDGLEKCIECGCELSGLEEICPKCGCVILKENTIKVTLKSRKEKSKDIYKEVVSRVKETVLQIKSKYKSLSKKVFKKENLTRKNITIVCGLFLVLMLIIVIVVKIFSADDDMFTKVELGMNVSEVKGIINGDNSTSVDLKNMVMILNYEDSEVIGINGKTEYVFKDNGSYLYQIKFSFPYDEKNIEKMREYLDDEYGDGNDEGRIYKYSSDEVEYEFTNGESVTDQIVKITMK